MTTSTPKHSTTRRPKKPTAASAMQPMTLEQFRSYLRGIMFVGGENWHPDRQQWELIVAMIDNLVVEQAPVTSNTTGTQYAISPDVPMYNYVPSIVSQPPQNQIPANIPESGLLQAPIDENSDSYRTPFV